MCLVMSLCGYAQKTIPSHSGTLSLSKEMMLPQHKGYAPAMRQTQVATGQTPVLAGGTSSKRMAAPAKVAARKTDAADLNYTGYYVCDHTQPGDGTRSFRQSNCIYMEELSDNVVIESINEEDPGYDCNVVIRNLLANGTEIYAVLDREAQTLSIPFQLALSSNYDYYFANATAINGTDVDLNYSTPFVLSLEQDSNGYYFINKTENPGFVLVVFNDEGSPISFGATCLNAVSMLPANYICSHEQRNDINGSDWYNVEPYGVYIEQIDNETLMIHGFMERGVVLVEQDEAGKWRMPTLQPLIYTQVSPDDWRYIGAIKWPIDYDVITADSSIPYIECGFYDFTFNGGTEDEYQQSCFALYDGETGQWEYYSFGYEGMNGGYSPLTVFTLYRPNDAAPLGGSADPVKVKDALTAGTAECWTGETLELPVFITNGDEVRDIQFDIELGRSGAMLQTVECNLPGYTATFSKLQSKPGYRVMISSMTGATIPAGNKALLCTLRTTETTSQYYGQWSITDIAISHPDGEMSYPASKSYNLNIRRFVREAQLDGDYIEANPGETVLLPIYLRSNYEVRDFQFDIYIASGFTLNEVVDVPAGYSAAFNRLQNGNYRVLLTSLTGTTLPASENGLLCHLKVTLPETSGWWDWRIESPVFSYSDGELNYGGDSWSEIHIKSIPTVSNVTCTLSDEEVSLNNDWSFHFNYSFNDFNYSYGKSIEGYIADEEGNVVQEFNHYDSSRLNYVVYFNLDRNALEGGKTYTVVLSHLKLGEYYDQNNQQCWDYDQELNLSWTFRTQPIQTLTFDFQKGWNWFSYNIDDYLLNNNWDFGFAVAPYVTYFANQTDQTTYDEEDGGWYGYVYMTPSYSYKAYATESHTFKFHGDTLPSDWYEISLYPGWNWIGYLPAAPQYVSDAFADYQPEEGDFIKSQTESATYFDGQWIGDFVMEPGQGYLYKSCKTSGERYYYPTVAASESRAAHSSAARAAALTADNGFFAYDTHKYRDNMAIVARIEGDTEGRYVIGAYAVAADATVTSDMECRGKSIAASGLHLITAHGDDDTTTLRFAILDTFTGELYAAHETIDFDGTSAGTAAHPVVLSLGELIGNVTTGIRFSTIADSTDSDIYAIDGRRATRRTHGVVIESGRKTIVK